MNQELLHNYFKGNASIEEEKQILDWVESADENREAYLKERMLYDIAFFSEAKEAKKTKRLLLLKPILHWGMRTAAVIALAVCGYFLTNDYLYNQEALPQTITVPAGQRAQITLADGTKVWLNSKSTLVYAANFGREDRNVTLDGEAYFEVAKNKEIPFYVNTEINKIRVVGTCFNVCAYSGSNLFETTLVEGIVDIYTNHSDQLITRLTKDEFFGEYDGKRKKTVLPSYEYLRWKEGLYCFDDSEFRHILNRLQLYYNVNIAVKNPKLLDYRCTGKFKEQDGVEHILKVIQKDHPFRFRINEEKDSIIIYDK